MQKDFTGKTVLITGASSGIGRGMALAFGRAGAQVVVNFHTGEDEARQVAEEISKGGGQAIAVQANVSQEAEVEHLFNQAIAQFHKLDVVICNAGIQKDDPLLQMSLSEWQKVIDVNLTGYFLCARQAAKHFLQQQPEEQAAGRQCAGNIILVSSVHDIIPWAGHVNYAASKGGVLMLLKSLALELAPKKIRVNGISPGAIQTEINQDVWQNEEKAQALLKLIPYGRIGLPEDIAQAALWLASPQSDYVTGTTLYVDGGMTLYPGFVDNG